MISAWSWDDSSYDMVVDGLSKPESSRGVLSMQYLNPSMTLTMIDTSKPSPEIPRNNGITLPKSFKSAPPSEEMTDGIIASNKLIMIKQMLVPKEACF
mmetsp:Transcript_15288/g.24859  ORF Transcript_15288/g.24859 Transcript_15288/m.24859 type:complete len:98 (-) Transcript_15288:182-475(-)